MSKYNHIILRKLYNIFADYKCANISRCENDRVKFPWPTQTLYQPTQSIFMTKWNTELEKGKDGLFSTRVWNWFQDITKQDTTTLIPITKSPQFT